jgi:hypothetical protein
LMAMGLLLVVVLLPLLLGAGESVAATVPEGVADAAATDGEADGLMQ